MHCKFFGVSLCSHLLQAAKKQKRCASEVILCTPHVSRGIGSNGDGHSEQRRSCPTFTCIASKCKKRQCAPKGRSVVLCHSAGLSARLPQGTPIPLAIAAAPPVGYTPFGGSMPFFALLCLQCMWQVENLYQMTGDTALQMSVTGESALK